MMMSEASVHVQADLFFGIDVYMFMHERCLLAHTCEGPSFPEESMYSTEAVESSEKLYYKKKS